MKRIGMLFIGMMVLVGFHGYAHADSSADQILKAVVKIRSTIPQEADSAATLGTEREGNGVIIDSEGTILTVGYLIRDAKSIEVTGQDGTSIGARFLGYDFDTGFGLLKTEKNLGLEPIKLGHSSAVDVSDSILVVGHGGEESAQVTRVISRKEFAGYWEYLLDEAIYTVPAHANFGGAALINHEGELVGIGSLLTQVLIPGVGLISCNVSIPIDLLYPILADLMKAGRSGKAQKPWLGINAEETKGRIFITKITSGGPAEKAGLKPGDIILTVDGQTVYGLSHFYRKVWAIGNAGVQVPLSILQGTKVREIKVRSMDRYQHSKTESRKELTL